MAYTPTTEVMGDMMQRYDANGRPVAGPGQSASTGGGMDLSWLAPFLTGAGDLAMAPQAMRDAERASQMADPWAAHRGQYADQLVDYMGRNSLDPAASTARSGGAFDRLMGLLSNPGSVTSMPGYQYGMNQAMEGVNRGAGASGMLNSGNRLAALQDRGEGYARDWYKQSVSDLMGGVNAGIGVDTLGLNAQNQGFNQGARLAGLDVSNPVAAAQMLLNGRTNQDARIGQGVGGVANGIAGAAGQFLPWLQRGLGFGGGMDLSGNVSGGITDNYLETLFPGGSSQDIMNGINLDPGADWASMFEGLGGP